MKNQFNYKIRPNSFKFRVRKSAVLKSNRSKSSKAWLSEHVHDVYVHQAKQAGYRARSAYKLLEMNEKDRLIRQGDVIVDLGSTPGSWSQVAQELVGIQGQVFALDILPMEPIDGIHFIQGDFKEESVLHKLEALLNNRAVDLVISDMAPNMSGQAVTDQARSYYLAELALDFALNNLASEGRFLVKVFQGSGYQSFMQAMRAAFYQVQVRKPKASRERSSEIYLLGTKLR